MSLSTALTAILKSFGVFSILLLLGSFLRAKIPLFQKLYLPACVIGGFIGLIVGPNILGIVPFPRIRCRLPHLCQMYLLYLFSLQFPCASIFAPIRKVQEILYYAATIFSLLHFSKQHL